MSAFGHELKGERERRSISLDALCAETKISRPHLEALESGNFEDLPKGVFRRGILRAYLQALQLSENDWLPRFDELTTEAPDQNQDWTDFARNVSRNRTPSGAGAGYRWLGVVILMLTVAAAIWAVWKFVLHSRLSPQ